MGIEGGAYSYHNFFYPFYFEEGKKVSFKTYIESQTEKWKKHVLPNDKEELRKFFNSYQYFNDMARKALYGDIGIKSGNENRIEVVENYRYSLEEKKKPIFLINKKSKKNDEPYRASYELTIRSISLTIYNTNIGILCIELVNDKYPCLDQIAQINDYGRRVSLSCIPEKHKVGEQIFSIAANKIEFKGIRDVSCADRFTQMLGNIENETAEEIKNRFYKENILNGCSNYIWEMLKDKRNSKITIQLKKMNDNDEKIGKQQIVIQPIMDDRMFTQCLIKSKQISEVSKILFSCEGDNIVMNSKLREIGIASIKEAKEKLYKLIFMDSEECSCQNVSMLDEALDKNVYKRWSNCGTVFGVTQHSFVGISYPYADNEQAFNGYKAVVYFPFTTMYRDMARLAIAQRASIIGLAKIATDISSSINKKSTLDKKNILKIQKLQEKYVLCQNQLLLFEVSTQLQGIELYQMFQKEFFISEQKIQLEDQLKNLYEIANMDSSSRLNNFIMYLTVWSVGLALFQTIAAGLNENKTDNVNPVLGFYNLGIPLLLVILIIEIFKWHRKNKENISSVLVVLCTIALIYYIICICFHHIKLQY